MTEKLPLVIVTVRTSQLVIYFVTDRKYKLLPQEKLRNRTSTNFSAVKVVENLVVSNHCFI